jgi:ABC-2 type transport system permease protein
MAANATAPAKTAEAQKGASALLPVGGRGWSLGFANLLDNESRRWWGTRRWLVHLILWLVLINGLVALVTLMSFSEGTTPAEAFAEAADVFTGALAITTAIGAVAVAQGAIIGEKQLGTAAWVMSKPASRSAFVLSKLFATGGALLALAVLVPSAVFYIESLAFFGQGPPLDVLASTLGVLILHLGFYVALTLTLGTFFSGRGAVMGIGIGLIVAGIILGGALQPLAQVLPWPLMSLARLILIEAPLPADWLSPVVASAIWIVVLMAAALVRFGREEF